MAQSLGIVDLSWNGRKIAVEKGAKFTFGGIEQKPVVTGRRVDFAGEWMAGDVTGVTTLKRGDDLEALFAKGQGELQVLCDTDQTFTWPDAFLTNRANATGGDGGKVELKWAVGEPAQIIG